MLHLRCGNPVDRGRHGFIMACPRPRLSGRHPNPWRRSRPGSSGCLTPPFRPLVPWPQNPGRRRSSSSRRRKERCRIVDFLAQLAQLGPSSYPPDEERVSLSRRPVSIVPVPLILFAVPLGWPSSPHTKPLPPPSLGPLQPPPLLSSVECGGCWSPLRDWTPVQVRGDRPIRGGRGRGMGERKGNAPSRRRRDLMGLQGEAGAWGVNAGGYQGQNGSILV
ncbi:hypothetical protein BGZ61DRAFT_68346 [Ilyonectria robusta]|uniref:uncharacterized protein n=1 Tax=Ilyonectria robusta TaxID=1079257 RepID=UPI001E8E39F4|nr:uncharacterized protein BGZ61DRAFT_68346 [Ilyonectria robusta]KAH8679153.1 hypothetical protein BGZ61DRAFT_68346 [Ilyonectria robusta]